MALQEASLKLEAVVPKLVLRTGVVTFRSEVRPLGMQSDASPVPLTLTVIEGA
jgi:hypothetical protein